MRRRTILQVDSRRRLTLPSTCSGWAEGDISCQLNPDGSVTLRPVQVGTGPKWATAPNGPLPTLGRSPITPQPVVVDAPGPPTDGGIPAESASSAALVVVPVVSTVVPAVSTKAVSTKALKQRHHRREQTNDKTVLLTDQGFEVSEAVQRDWAVAYPAVDVPAAIRRAFAWAKANPEKRKKNWARFVVAWLARDQERGGSRRGPPTPQTLAERKAEILRTLKGET